MTARDPKRSEAPRDLAGPDSARSGQLREDGKRPVSEAVADDTSGDRWIDSMLTARGGQDFGLATSIIPAVSDVVM